MLTGTFGSVDVSTSGISTVYVSGAVQLARQPALVADSFESVCKRAQCCEHGPPALLEVALGSGQHVS